VHGGRSSNRWSPAPAPLGPAAEIEHIGHPPRAGKPERPWTDGGIAGWGDSTAPDTGDRGALDPAARGPSLHTALAALALLASGCSTPDRTAPGAPPRDLDEPVPSLEPLSAAEAPPAGGEHPDVVLITVDTWRADRLGLHGSPRGTSPFLERLADDALVFERALSTASWTWPSMVSIVTGLTPSEHGAISIDHAAPDGASTLAEVFAAAGYATEFIGWNSYLCADGAGFDQGYERYACHGASAEQIRDQLVDRLRESEDDPRPRFLHLHLFDPHCPYSPPSWALSAVRVAPMDRSDRCTPGDPLCADPGRADFFDLMAALPSRHARSCFLEPAGDATTTPPPRDFGPHGDTPQGWRDSGLGWAETLDLYDGELLYTDRMMADIAEDLDRAGRWSGAWVAMTGDHGEELGEHGRVGHGDNIGLETVHVPLLIRPPLGPDGRRDLRGLRLPRPVSAVDLAPTLAAVANVPAPEGWWGRSLVTRAAGDEAGAKAVQWPVVSEHQDVRLVQTDGLRLYIDRSSRRHPANGSDGPQHGDQIGHHLFLDGDGRDRRDLLVDPDPAVRQEAAAMATALAGAGPLTLRINRVFPPEPRVIDPGERAALEALGYLGAEKLGE
jgi:arylsulfatase A-like enzyme